MSEDKLKTIKTLRIVAKLLSDEKRWTQNVYASDAEGFCFDDEVSPEEVSYAGPPICFCLIGACSQVLYDEPIPWRPKRAVLGDFYLIESVLEELFYTIVNEVDIQSTPSGREYTRDQRITNWNDRSGRTHKEVIELIDKTIARLSER